MVDICWTYVRCYANLFESICNHDIIIKSYWYSIRSAMWTSTMCIGNKLILKINLSMIKTWNSFMVS